MTIAGNGRLITRNKNQPFIENGAVVWDKGLIVDLGTTGDMQKKYPRAAFLDAYGGLIMPGFINMHHHIYSAFARGLSIPNHNPKNFMDILDGLWWHLDRKLSLEDTLLSARCVYLDCIKNGVTTIFDHHASFGSIEGSLDKISQAAKEAGVKSCLCYEVSDRDGTEKSALSIEENERFIKAAASDPDLNAADMQYAMMGIHASFTVGDKTLDKCATIAARYNTGCHIHTAEAIDDVNQCVQKYGKRVIERLKEHSILNAKTIAVHCVHIDKNEMDILKETDTMVVHNPQSNMGNAVGVPDVLKQFSAGIMLGLGTDGFTSDMCESYKTANVLHKHISGNPNAAWTEIPEMLFDHNARMANRYFKNPVGVLKPGASADIIITDYRPLTPLNANNINGHILFGVNGRNTVSTVIAGKIVMKDRKFTELDEERILAQSREQAAKLWKNI